MFGSIISLFCSTRPFKGKQRILRALGFLPFRDARSYYGVRLTENVADSTYRASMVGSYGDFLSDVIRERQKPFVFLDIGANQGLYTLIAATNPMLRRAFAVEPSPNTFGLLARNVELNGCQDRVTPIAGAISGERGLVVMDAKEGHSGASSMFTRGGMAIRVVVLSPEVLTDVLSECGDDPILVKLDVEGAELLVLSELDRLGVLARCSALLVELSANIRGRDHGGEVATFLEDHGWEMKAREGSSAHHDALFVNAGGDW